MSTRHDEWFEPLLAEDWTTENRGDVAEAAIGFLTFAGLILVLVAVWSLLVLGAFYLGSYVTDLLFFGQLFGS